MTIIELGARPNPCTSTTVSPSGEAESDPHARRGSQSTENSSHRFFMPNYTPARAYVHMEWKSASLSRARGMHRRSRSGALTTACRVPSCGSARPGLPKHPRETSPHYLISFGRTQTSILQGLAEAVQIGGPG